MKDTVWVKFECEGGSRWTSTKGLCYEDHEGQASAWFKRGGQNATRS